MLLSMQFYTMRNWMNLVIILFLYKEVGADAVIYGDPAVLMTAGEVAPDMKLHWNTETLATNWYTCNYWGSKGAKRSVLAREINMDGVIEIKEHAEVEIEVQVHGMTAMFQSKRSLLGHYFEYQGKALEIENRKQIEICFCMIKNGKINIQFLKMQTEHIL